MWYNTGTILTLVVMSLKRMGALLLVVWWLLMPALAENMAWDQTEWAAVTAALTSDEVNPVPESRRIIPHPNEVGGRREDPWMTILLLSSDSPDMEQNFGRADVTLVCAVNIKTGDIRLLSLPQYTPVSLEGTPGRVALKHVNCFGGPLLMIKSVNEALQLHIERYCAVNFQSFVDVVDVLGGIKISLTEQEAQALGMETGENRLNGEQALRYVRLRQEGSGKRPRELLKAILAQTLAEISVKQMFSLMEIVFPALDTNLTMGNLVDLLFAVIDAEAGAEVSTLSLSTQGTKGFGPEDAANACAFLFGE